MSRTVAPRHVPSRSCVACRTVRPKRELLRLVRTVDGTVSVDPTGRLAGRGAYICRADACLDKAIAKGVLSRALRTPLPADLRTSLAGSISAYTTDVEGGSRGQE